MNSILTEILFGISFLTILNGFVLYPLIIIYLSKITNKEETGSGYSPAVTIFISVYNEEKVIGKRVKNLASLNYDKLKMAVIICSDASTDKTNEILLKLESDYKWLKIYISNKRRGKAGVINEYIKKVNTDLIVFSDANTIFDKDALYNLVQLFKDARVGMVSGRLILKEETLKQNESVEELKYWSLETLIKKAEGDLNILIGANGGIFAIRKNLFEEIPTSKAVTDDFFISLLPLLKGYKAKYCYNAVAIENIGKNIKEELNRKIRFSATNYATLFRFKGLFSSLFSITFYAYFSHKITRWFLPFILGILFFSNIYLFNYNIFFNLLFYFQTAFYLSALIGFFFSLTKIRLSLFSFPFYFIVTNVAILIGFINFLRGKNSVIWEPTKR